MDQINFVIDLTDDTEEMEDDTTPLLVPIVVKTEPTEVAEVVAVNNVASVYNESGIRVSRRLELAKTRKAIMAFGQSLRKKDIIPEKEAPLAASSNVIADNDTDMAEDVSANPVESVTVNTESGNNSMTYEQTMAAIDAAIADN